MKRLSKWVFLVASGCLLALTFSSVGGTSGPGNGQIVFVKQHCYSSRHCHTQVALVNQDGSGVRVLTSRRFHVASPRWSPDRTEIAYIRTAWPPQVWLMAADGTHQRQLTRLPQGVLSVGLPSLDWSPNGRQIVFAAYPSTDGGASQLYLANVRTGTTTLLLQEAIGIYSGDDNPAWSPNGRWIAFVRHGRSVPDQIFMLSTATGSVSQLTHDPTYVSWHPTWSPDSRRIAFWGQRGGIWRMNADGSHLRHLAGAGNEPSWSPDGKWIVFASSIRPKARLAEIRPNGGGRHAITTFPQGSRGIQPDW
jgi:Tol biopolymer transport system component